MHYTRDKSFDILRNRYFRGDEDVIKLLRRTAVAVCEDAFRHLGPPYWFTDHGPSHSDRVLSSALKFANSLSEFIRPFETDEMIALTAACYLHDVAMVLIPEDMKARGLQNGWTKDLIRSARQWHVVNVNKALEKEKYAKKLTPLFRRSPLLQRRLPALCKAHGTDAHAKACSDFRTMADTQFSGEFLGKILLLADELDLTHLRTPLDDHPQWEDFPLTAKAHHFKHHYVVDVDFNGQTAAITFGFPLGMPSSDKEAYIRWICGKLRDQLNLATENLPDNLQAAFRIHIETREEPLASRVSSPDDVMEIVREFARKYTKPVNDVAVRVKPNTFISGRDSGQTPVALKEIDRLMDDFFEECTTSAALRYFDRIYIRVAQNDSVAQALLDEAHRFVRGTHTISINEIRPSHNVFCITGPAGAGKSAMLQHLMVTGKLRTHFTPAAESLVVVHVDCLKFLDLVSLIQTILSKILKECLKSSVVQQALAKSGWLEALAPSKTSLLDGTQTTRAFRSLMDFLHTKSDPHFRRALPVCMLLDNLDRAPGGEEFQDSLCRETMALSREGLGFYVLALRNGTKISLDASNDDMRATSGNPIRAPKHNEILAARVDVAFSAEVLSREGGWYDRKVSEARLGDLRLTLPTMRSLLEWAMRSLTEPSVGDQNSLIPAMAGDNMRDALTLFRAAVKSITSPDLIVLGSTHRIEISTLIESLARERFGSYYGMNSKIRNLFELNTGSMYFVKLYIIDLLIGLQALGPKGDNYVKLKEWRQRAYLYNIPHHIFDAEAWSLMTKDFPLVEVEHHDGRLPCPRYRTMDELGSDAKVRVSPAGEYYREWMLTDSGYLRCVMEDTQMDEPTARKIATQIERGQRMAQIQTFRRFLEETENRERATLALDEYPPMVAGRLSQNLR